MNLLQRHILKRVFMGTLVALASAVSVFATTQVLNHVDVLITSREATLKSLELAAVTLPALVEVLLPLAFLLGAIRIFAVMNADSELAALEAGGGGPAITAAPIYALSLAFALAILPLSLFVEPLANRGGRGIVAAADLSEFVQATAKPGTFATLGDGLFIRVDDKRADGSYGGLIFVDMRDPTAEKIFYAKNAAIARTKGIDVLNLNDGVIQRRNATDGNLISVGFQSYAVDLSELSPRITASGTELKERSTASLLFGGGSDPIVRTAPENVRAELHRRFSDWLYAFAFGSIVLFFAGNAKTGRHGRLGNIATAILVALVIRGLGFVALSGAGKSLLSAFFVYAVPLGSFVLFAWLGLRRGAARGAGPQGARILARLAFGGKSVAQSGLAKTSESRVVDRKFLRSAWHAHLGTSDPKTTLEL